VRVAVIGLSVAVIARSADQALIDRAPTCAALAQARDWATAVGVCQLELRHTQDPATGVHLATALDKTGEVAAAQRTASLLLTTSARSDALYLLGRIAHSEHRTEAAITALEAARAAHRAEQRPYELARDCGVLAMARLDNSELTEALRLVDECIAQAQRAASRSLEHYCHLAAAKALNRTGYWGAADQELKHAEQLSSSDAQRGDLAYQRASYEQERGNHATAISQLDRAQALVGSADGAWTINLTLNRAYSFAELNQLAAAVRDLQTATWLDFEDKKLRERTWVAAQIAYRQHDLTRAAALTDKYSSLSDHDDSVDRDDRIDVAILRARIELERGDLDSAARHAGQGVELAEVVRGAQSTLELRPWVLARRRAAYELRFLALARAGQVEDAAMVFDAWQGRSVQDVLVTPRPPAGLGYGDTAAQLTRLGDWLRVASPAGFAGPADRASVMHAMRGIDLLALIVADGELWRLTASHGAPRLARLASLADLNEQIKQFRTRATDVELASELGALLVPDEAFGTPEVLHVVLDGQLSGLPVAALRHDGVPLIAIRPIVRQLRLPETRCVPASRPGRATVIGVSDATIPHATDEADAVARVLQTTSATGAAATRAALLAATSDAVLHVAAHAAIGLDGSALMLGDGDLSALEISARRVAPALVVLSACDAATSDGPELAGSLAAAFLGAGSRHVVATLRPISDHGAPSIAARFYRAGGVADPARALAAVQAALARTNQPDWPYFAVFGPEVCRVGAADRK
jgi:tetratricopeptide (TPR) repeat protein